MAKINRRQFLTFSAAGASTAIFTSCKRGKSSYSKTLGNSSLDLPQLHKSTNGLLELGLQASERPVNLDGKQADLLTYNGQIPAPRLEAKAGDQVRIHFTNNLSQPTNIHYHGLHIPIVGNADNVFLKIKPGDKLTYEFKIPLNHPGGTFWYHPHLHGLVAEQLFGGLAGLFIVRGELDAIPEIKAAKEEFLVLQDFALDNDGKPIDSAQMSLMAGREGDIITINGQVNPSLSLSEAGLLRLRILNASPSRFYRLVLEDHPFYQIATDGGGMMGRNRNNRRNESITLATLNYESSTNSLSLPSKLTSIPQLPQPQQVRRFELNHGMNPGLGMGFLINGEPYQGDRLDTEVKLGTVEDWEIINAGKTVYHCHILDHED
ncbi:MAG: multicopper oxidase domain-containing protein [Spirulinaceae cyanobacterium]